MKKILILLSFLGFSHLGIASADKYIAQYAGCIAALSASKIGADRSYRDEVDQVLPKIKSGMSTYIASEAKGSRILSDRLFNLAAVKLSSEYDFYDQVLNIGGNKALISEVRVNIQKNCNTLPK